MKVALELTSTLPSQSDISRWFAEPVEMIIIPSYLFETLKNNNQIVLNERCQKVCMEFLRRTKAKLAVRCTHDDPWLDCYVKCLRSSFSSLNRSNGVKHAYVFIQFRSLAILSVENLFLYFGKFCLFWQVQSTERIWFEIANKTIRQCQWVQQISTKNVHGLWECNQIGNRRSLTIGG